LGTIHSHPPVKLIIGVLRCADQPVEDIHRAIENRWGPIESQTDGFDFSHTSYYEDEMGRGLIKHYLGIGLLVDVDRMTAIKIESNDMEKEFTKDGRRRANIDPGYLADAKILMMTTKNLAHRVYVGRNLYVDLQLIYKKDSYYPMPWAFADMREPAVIRFFNAVRKRYQEQLRTTTQFEGGFDS
jgi:hypothetical protein